MLGETRFTVLDTGGHTLGHISLSRRRRTPSPSWATPCSPWAAVACSRARPSRCGTLAGSKLTALPDATTVYCAHEYTASNARFALSVDSSATLAARAEAVFAARARDEATVPTTIGAEKATNPFLRAPLLRPDAASAAQAFAEIRAAKDGFKG